MTQCFTFRKCGLFDTDESKPREQEQRSSFKKEENLRVTDGLPGKIKIIHFDEKAGKCFGKIKASLKSKGQIISDSDIFIAATAISNTFTLLTNNEAHFGRIENLTIENWTS